MGAHLRELKSVRKNESLKTVYDELKRKEETINSFKELSKRVKTKQK